MAFGTTATLSDPLTVLTEGQPRSEMQEKEHDRLMTRIENALRGETEREFTDQCQGELRLAVEHDSIWVYKDNSQSALELYQLGLPLLRRICATLGA